MMEMGMCTQSSVTVSACPVPLGERREAMFFFFFFLIVHLSALRKKKDRCQNSELIVLTKPADNSHILLSTLLSREFNEKPIMCPDHHFFPQPVTYCMSVLIEFTRTQSASFSLSLTVRSALSELCKNCAATHLPDCLQTFYTTVSAIVKDDRASRVTKKKREREKEAYSFYYCACISY